MRNRDSWRWLESTIEALAVGVYLYAVRFDKFNISEWGTGIALRDGNDIELECH